MIDRILLGGKTEGVIPHRVKDIEPFQPLIPGIDIAGDITQGVAYMQPGAAGIGKHIQDIAFRPGGIVGYLIAAFCRPALLPFLLYIAEIIFHSYGLVRGCWK